MPILPSTLLGIAPKGNAKLCQQLAPVLDDALRGWPRRRIAHFLAQAAHETAGFTTLEEYGGKTEKARQAYFARYDNRPKLGNVYPGDGYRFHGRGIFQLTGRDNYATMGRRLGVDLVNNPGMAAEPALSVRIAVLFWKARQLDRWADADNVEEVTRIINGGKNGLEERKRYLVAAKRQFAVDQSPDKPIMPNKPAPLPKPADAAPEEKGLPADLPAGPIAPDPPKRWWESTEIRAAIAAGLAGIAKPIHDLIDGIDTPMEVAALLGVIAFIGGAVIYIAKRRMDREG